MSVISIQELQVNYDHVIALKQVSFDVKPLEFIGIIGPNGGGKTTLVKTILGILKPKAGKIHIKSSEVIGYVPQLTTFDRQFPITVKEVILTGHLPKHIKLGHRFSAHEIEHALSVMKHLGIENLKDRQIGTLSGGQMQRTMIARALMNHPTILILDEPTAGVDESSKKEIYKMLHELNQNMTILMITHDTSKLLKYTDRVIYINKTVHIHEQVGQEESINTQNNTCPINWFIQNEKIQKVFLDKKEKINDRSNT